MSMKSDLSLRDDPSMPPALRRDLDRYTQGTMVAYDEERGFARLTASLALTSAAVCAPSAATGVKAMMAKALALPGIHVAVVSLAVAATGATAVTVASRASRPTPMATVHVVPAQMPRMAPHVALPSHVDVASVVPDDAVDPETLPLAPPATTVSAKAPPRVAAPMRAETLERPRDVSLREAMAALIHLREVAATDPAAAVALAAQYETRYGKDDLYAEEREAIAIDALARSGRSESARARARAFLDLHPKSPFAALVRGALAPSSRSVLP